VCVCVSFWLVEIVLRIETMKIEQPEQGHV